MLQETGADSTVTVKWWRQHCQNKVVHTVLLQESGADSTVTVEWCRQ
jgi:hypothetical protein